MKKREEKKDKGAQMEQTTVPKPRAVPAYIASAAKKNLRASSAAQAEVEKAAIHGKIDSLNASKFIQFMGSKLFRLRIVCSLLSGKAIRIDDIRVLDTKPGLRDYELSFLRLVDRITNGTKLKINETGTCIKFTPGVLLGGDRLEHECPPTRCVGYYLEPLLLLAPFAKEKMSIRLTGCVTNMDTDLSADIIRAVTIQLLKQFGMGVTDPAGNVSPAPSLKILKRGAPPSGGGEVLFECPIVKELTPIALTDPGRIKRVRGVAYTTRCSQALGQRMANAAKLVFNNFIPDVHIYTDHFKGKDTGASPGYSISLAAESTTGCVVSAQRTSMSPSALNVLSEIDPKLVPMASTDLDAGYVADAAGGRDDVAPGIGADAEGAVAVGMADKEQLEEEGKSARKRLTAAAEAAALMLPENVGRIAAKAVIEEVAEGGCIDSAHQSMFLLLMALGPEDASSLRVGRLSDQAVQTLRLLKEFWGITFKITPDPETRTVLLSCLGVGFSNFARRTV